MLSGSYDAGLVSLAVLNNSHQALMKADQPRGTIRFCMLVLSIKLLCACMGAYGRDSGQWSSCQTGLNKEAKTGKG